MLLAWIIFVLMLVFSLYDIKKAIIIWMPLRLLFNPQIAIRYASPGMSLDIAVSIWLVLLYFIKYHRAGNEQFFYKRNSWIIPISVAFFISYAVSLLFSPNLNVSVFTAIIKTFVMFFGIVYIFQRVLKTDQDIKLFLQTTFVVILLITLLGIYQIIMNDNPFLDYVYMNSPHDETTKGRMFYTPPWIVDETQLRYGMIRCCSFFSFHVPFGVACVILLFFIGFLWKNKVYPKYEKTVIICIVLLCVGFVISNSKQAYVGAAVILFCFFKAKEIFSYHLFLLIIVLIGIWYLMPELFNNYLSLFDDKLAEEGGGSTVALRESQYNIALEMFSMNPLFGNGPNSLEVLRGIKDRYTGILGAESIFLLILPERGLLGVFCYVYMYYVLYTRLVRNVPRHQLLFFLLAYFVMEVAGGQKDMTLFLGILVVVEKICIYKKKQIVSDRVCQRIAGYIK